MPPKTVAPASRIEELLHLIGRINDYHAQSEVTIKAIDGGIHVATTICGTDLKPHAYARTLDEALEALAQNTANALWTARNALTNRWEQAQVQLAKAQKPTYKNIKIIAGSVLGEIIVEWDAVKPDGMEIKAYRQTLTAQQVELDVPVERVPDPVLASVRESVRRARASRDDSK